MKEKAGESSEHKYPLLPNMGVKVEVLDNGRAQVVYDSDNPVDRNLLDESIAEAQSEETQPIFNTETTLHDAKIHASIINLAHFETHGEFLNKYED